MKKKKIDTVFADTFTKVRFYSSAISGIKKDNGATIELSALKDADYDLVGVNSSDKFKMNLEIEFFIL